MQVIDFLVDRRLDLYWHTIPVLVKLTDRPSLLQAFTALGPALLRP